MKAMKSFLLRLPEPMSDAVAAICEELHCGKSQFVRTSIVRNLELSRLEMQLLSNHHREAVAKQLKVLTSISNDGKESQ